MHTDPERALSLAREHASRFPGGALTQEREVVLADALDALGRFDEAEARADDALREDPDSFYRERLDDFREASAEDPALERVETEER